MVAEVKKMSDYSDSCMHWSPQECLEDVLSEFDDPDCDIDGVLVIKISRENGDFIVSRATSKMRTTEVIAACEVVRARALDNMK